MPYPQQTEAKDGVFELCAYFAVCLVAGMIYSRFSGTSWFGDFPAAGAVFAFYLAAARSAFAAESGGKSALRLAVPTVFIYLFYSQVPEGIGFVGGLQSRLGVPHFLIVVLFTGIAVHFTSSEVQAAKQAEVSRDASPEAPVKDPLEAFDRIVGQDHVIEPLKEIARLARSGIRVGKRNAPYAVLLFLGPTGVGKTEAATALAEAVFGSKDYLIRFDMGQFTDSHQASRFYGPPPGYAGYEEGGQLTRAVMRKPRAVVLLDEVEKAHPQIWDAFLPVFDEGYIVDGSSNQRADMTRTLIVLTSNLLAGETGLQKLLPHELKERVQAAGAFRPELLGRINEVLVFRDLDEATKCEILRRRLDAALWSLAEQGITVSIGESDVAALMEEVKQTKFGVRQIDDIVRKFLRQAIAGGK